MASILKKKIAIIGCGNIASFHVESLNNSGFKVEYAASTKNSKTIKKFAEKHKIINYFNDPLEMIKKINNEVDAYLISTPVEDSIKYLKILNSSNKPILLEKPGAFNYRKLLKFKNNNKIFLAYNRRFYHSVDKFKDAIRNFDNLLINVEVPEKFISSKTKNFYQKYLYYFGNTVHIIDLLFYLFGNIKLIHVSKNKDKDNIKSIIAILKSNKHLINFVCNFKGSSNFRITAENSENKFELKPIEYLNIYKGMNVSEPKGKNKLRKFFPKKISESYLPKIEIDYKPGFLLQSKEFYKMLNSKSKTKLANVKDSINALKLLERIIK
jgi:predicted dehydrogenase